MVESAQPAALPHSDFSRDGAFLAMEQFFPGQKEFFQNRDFDLLKSVPYNEPPFSMKAHLSVCGKYSEVRTMTGRLPYAILKVWTWQTAPC